MVENDLSISSQELRVIAFHRTLHKVTSVVANADHEVWWKSMWTLFVIFSPSSYSFLTSSLFLWEGFFSLPFSLSGGKTFFIFLEFWSFSYSLGFRDTSAKSGSNTYNRAKAGTIPASAWKLSVVFFWVFLNSSYDGMYLKTCYTAQDMPALLRIVAIHIFKVTLTHIVYWQSGYCTCLSILVKKWFWVLFPANVFLSSLKWLVQWHTGYPLVSIKSFTILSSGLIVCWCEGMRLQKVVWKKNPGPAVVGSSVFP